MDSIDTLVESKMHRLESCSWSNFGLDFTAKIFGENQLDPRKLVAFFEQLVPERRRGKFFFNQGASYASVNDFLNACLVFYKIVVEQPGTISILCEEETIPFSRKELVSLFKEFPDQLFQFIASEIDTDFFDRPYAFLNLFWGRWWVYCNAVKLRLTLEGNIHYTQDVVNWLNAVQTYIQITDISLLDVSFNPKFDLTAKFLPKDMFDKDTFTVPIEALECILMCLSHSQITELRFDFANFWITSLHKLVKNTNIKKIDFGSRRLTIKSIFALMDIVENSNVEDLGNFVFSFEYVGITQGKKLIPRLLHSGLSKLNLKFSYPPERSLALMLTEGLPESSITSLWLNLDPKYKYPAMHGIMGSLFLKLPYCQIKDLNLSYNVISDNLMNVLSQNLANSKVETLNLGFCYITDAAVSVLGEGLVNSKVAVLNLSGNDVKGLNSFMMYVSQTKLKVLDFSMNIIENPFMFSSFKYSLTGSLIESLDFSNNEVHFDLEEHLLENLSYSSVTKLNLKSRMYSNRNVESFGKLLSLTKVENLKMNLRGTDFDVFSESVKYSKLQSISVQGIGVDDIFSLNFVTNPSLTSVKLKAYFFSSTKGELLVKPFIGAHLTHLSIVDCHPDDFDFIRPFALILKRTSITHLRLSKTGLTDSCVEVLAKNLEGTKISKLDLSENEISEGGAMALGFYCPQTSIIALDLHCNDIHDFGLQYLATRFSGSFLTTLVAWKNPGEQLHPINKMLLENRLRSQKIVTFFQQLIPKNCGKNFCFSPATGMNIKNFLQSCLKFYKTVVTKPAAISVLSEDNRVPFSRKELVSLFKEFPSQFLQFVENEIEADVWSYVELLEKAEELGLVEIVKGLLLHRPLYYIDEAGKILHPRVYLLLHKYKVPIINTDVEPAGIKKVIKYFVEHSSIEGSIQLINLLSYS